MSMIIEEQSFALEISLKDSEDNFRNKYSGMLPQNNPYIFAVEDLDDFEEIVIEIPQKQNYMTGVNVVSSDTN